MNKSMAKPLLYSASMDTNYNNFEYHTITIYTSCYVLTYCSACLVINLSIFLDADALLYKLGRPGLKVCPGNASSSAAC